MTILIILGCLLLLGAAAVLAAAVVLMRIAAKPRRSTVEKSIQYVKDGGLYGDFDELEKEELLIPSYDRYELHGFYLPCEGSDKYVIITHGITDTCYGSVRYANLYHKLGLNVVIYDLRNHGRNRPDYTTMGIRESKDLQAVIGCIRERFGKDIKLGIHGESLGSATSILSLYNGLGLSFCVADCGYSDLIKLMNYLTKEIYRVPSFFIRLGSMLGKLIYHYSFYDIRPIDNLKENTTPLLFVHGTADTYIPPHMSQDMYDAAECYKEIEFFEGAKHAQSIESNPQKYYEMLERFLKNIKFLV